MLTKHISQVKVSLAPFSRSAKSSRLLLARIVHDQAGQDNPPKIVTTMLSERNATPLVSIQYKDGKTIDVNPGELSFEDLMTIVNKHAKYLQQKEESSG